MKLLKRIMNLGRQGIEKTVSKYEDDIYQLEREVSKYKESRQKISDSLVELKGVLNKSIRDKEYTESLVSRFEKGAKKALLENNEKLAKEAFTAMNNNKLKVQNFEKTIESYKDTITKITSQLEIIDGKISAMQNKVMELKVKDQFTKNVNTINSTVNGINSVMNELNELSNEHVDKIETKFYVSEAKLESLNSMDDLNNLVSENDYDFEKYKESILKGE